MKQIEIYKKALKVMEKARVSTSRMGHAYWTAETFLFVGLCRLIYDLSTASTEATARFKLDSEIVIGKELDEDDFWLIDINEDEPKARAERIEHLKKLIELHEDEDE